MLICARTKMGIHLLCAAVIRNTIIGRKDTSYKSVHERNHPEQRIKFTSCFKIEDCTPSLVPRIVSFFMYLNIQNDTNIVHKSKVFLFLRFNYSEYPGLQMLFMYLNMLTMIPKLYIRVNFCFVSKVQLQ